MNGAVIGGFTFTLDDPSDDARHWRLRGKPPADPTDVLSERSPSKFKSESIGILVDPADIVIREARVRARFGFLTHLHADERRWAACNPRDRYEVSGAIAELGVM
jgi:uncharacterized protein